MSHVLLYYLYCIEIVYILFILKINDDIPRTSRFFSVIYTLPIIICVCNMKGELNDMEVT